jgi:hypothetical protein
MTATKSPVKIMGYVVTNWMVSGVSVSRALWEKTVKLILMNAQAIHVDSMAGK